MERSLNKFFIIVTELLITALLVVMLIVGAGYVKEVYDKTYEQEKNISYVEKEPIRDTYPFEH